MPCVGAVLHTVNVRLFEDDLEYIFNHAGDRVLFVDAALAERLAPLRRPAADGRAGRRDRRRRYRGAARRVATRRSSTPAPRFDCPALDDRAPPRPVLHERHDRQARRASSTRTARRRCTRSRICAADAIGVSSSDRVLPVVPMFHANAWGLPYGAAMTGADLLLPGRFTARAIAAGADAGRARDVRRRGADGLARPAARGRRAAAPTCRACAPSSAAARRCRSRSCRPSRSATACASSRRGG